MQTDEERALQRRLNLIIAGLVVLILAILVTFLLSRKQQLGSASISQAFAQNIVSPFRESSQDLYFYTGHGFADLNLSTLKTKQLGGLRTLPQTLPNVQWYKDGAVIRTANYDLFDELGMSVASDPSNVDGSNPIYLWYVPFNAAPIPLDKHVLSSYVDQASGTIYYLQQGDALNSNLVKAYSIKNGTTTTLSVANITSDSQIVFADNGTVFIMLGGNVPRLLAHTDGTADRTVLGNVFNSSTASANQSFVMTNVHFAVLLRSNGSGDDLDTYNLDTGEFKVIIHNFKGTLNTDSGSSVMASGTSDKKITFTSITSANDSHTESIVKPSGNTSSAYQISNKELVYVDNVSRAYLVSSDKADLANLPTVKSTGLEKAIAPSNDYSVVNQLNNATNGNSYALYLADPAASSGAEFLQNAIKAGYDPNQLMLQILTKLN